MMNIIPVLTNPPERYETQSQNDSLNVFSVYVKETNMRKQQAGREGKGKGKKD